MRDRVIAYGVALGAASVIVDVALLGVCLLVPGHLRDLTGVQVAARYFLTVLVLGTLGYLGIACSVQREARAGRRRDA